MGFLDWINQFVSDSIDIQAELQAIFAFLVYYIQVLFVILYNFLIAVGNFLYSILKGVGTFFKFLWDNFFKGVLGKLFNGILKVHDWLEAHLQPVIDFLKKVRGWYDAFFNHYIRPFINLLQHVRQFLLVLRLLHVKFAAQLDTYIAQIEIKVAGVFLQVRAVLTGLINIANILADPTGMLRHPTTVIAIRRSIPAIFHSVTGLPISFFFPGKDTNPLTSPSAIDPRISFDFMSTDELPDDSDLEDLPPLDYFLDSGLGLGSSDATVSVFGITLLRTSAAQQTISVDLYELAQEVALSFGLQVAVSA